MLVLQHYSEDNNRIAVLKPHIWKLITFEGKKSHSISLVCRPPLSSKNGLTVLDNVP